MPNFPGRYISWEGGHALKRCKERNKAPEEVEREIRGSAFVEQRSDGRFSIIGCVGDELTQIIVAEQRSDAVVVVTVVGKGKRCS